MNGHHWQIDLLLTILGCSIGWSPGRAQAQPKPLAYAILPFSAGQGNPEITSPAQLRHILPDPRLADYLQKLGFAQGTAMLTPRLTVDYLKQFNVVVCLAEDLSSRIDSQFAEMAEEKKKRLLEYVQQGGGLLVLRSPAYQFGTDIERLNRWLAPCGIKILPEQVMDEKNRARKEFTDPLYWTDNLTAHPVTEGVKGILYPDAMGTYRKYTDFTSPVEANKDWQIVLRGKETASSMVREKGGALKSPVPGTCKSAPPLLAVRDYGKGRIAVWPIAATTIWQDGWQLKWGSGVVMDGEVDGRRGDALRLLRNLLLYLSEPSRGSFGGYSPKKPKQAQKKDIPQGFRPLEWDKMQPAEKPAMPKCCVGLIGARSALSTGEGTPEEFIDAAKKAGYDFIAFAENLHELTADEFERLKHVCAEQSSDTFKAYPGILYLDESGNSWVTFSERLSWPKKEWWSEKFPKRLHSNNALSRGWGWPPVICIKSHHQPEEPWRQGNYKVFSIYTYENGKLVDDSLDHYRRLQKESFKLAPVAVHLVDSPDAVTQARHNGWQTYVRWYDANVSDALSGLHARYRGRYVFVRSSFVSQGPIFESCGIMNMGTSDLARPGGDRFRVYIRASSPVGLKEVAIFDGETKEPWRCFLPGGSKEFRVTFDQFHDRQYSLTVVLTDMDGKKAIRWENWTNVQENMFVRCGDNFNTMPGGKWGRLPAHLSNRRGIEDYTYRKRSISYSILPISNSIPETKRPAIEFYPRMAGRFGSIIECRVEGHYPESATPNVDRTDVPEVAVPNECLTGKARIVFFSPRTDSSAVQWVEGEFRALKDLEAGRFIVFHSGQVRGDTFFFTREDGSVVCDKDTWRKHRKGVLPNRGYVGITPDPFKGSVGAIALQSGLQYNVMGRDRPSSFILSLSDIGPQIKAGMDIRYRYLTVFSTLDPEMDNRFLEDVCRKMGLRGKPGYEVSVVSGSVESTEYILRLKARDHGFSGRFSQADLPVDIPVMIDGLNPNWDAGIWYKGGNTLIIPEYHMNDVGERYLERTPRPGKDQLIHIPVMADGLGFLQVDPAVGAKDVYIGNLLQADNPSVRLTLVDVRKSRIAFVVHNPTDAPVACRVTPGPGFTLLGDFETQVEVPPGASVRVLIPSR